MKQRELEAWMRALESARDAAALPGVYLVLRLDGRGFSRLTKERHAFARPFDERFRDMMLETAEHLMGAGPRVAYAYTQSDEISLLLPREEEAFSRRVQKLCSVMAGEASGRFSVLLGEAACFDCRVIELPREEDAAGYFLWRQEDAHRNALSAWCYWTLRGAGADAAEATRRVGGLSVAGQNELLFTHGINFNDLPGWQKRGVALYWETLDLPGRDPITGRTVTASRRRIRRETDLPMRDEYVAFVRSLLARASARQPRNPASADGAEA